MRTCLYECCTWTVRLITRAESPEAEKYLDAHPVPVDESYFNKSCGVGEIIKESSNDMD